jgi:hypothetical protein
MAGMAQEEPEKVYSSIRQNNLPQLKTLSANTADDRGITPLMYAAEVGSLDVMRLLIERGADVNAQNAFGSTALMWSASDPAKVRLLLDHGAQVNTAARSGRTALIIAAFTNPSADVVRRSPQPSTRSRSKERRRSAARCRNKIAMATTMPAQMSAKIIHKAIFFQRRNRSNCSTFGSMQAVQRRFFPLRFIQTADSYHWDLHFTRLNECPEFLNERLTQDNRSFR